MSIRLLMDDLGALTVWLPASHLAVPRATPIIPRVTMKGIMLKPAMITPLTNPTAAPTPRVSAMATAAECPFTSVVAPTTLARATTEPTLKSIPPLTMIMVIPSAPMATITVCRRISLQLVPEKKCKRTSELRENRPITRRSPNTGPMELRRRATLTLLNLVGRLMCGSKGRRSGLPRGCRHQSVLIPIADGTHGRQDAPAHHSDRVAHAEQLG